MSEIRRWHTSTSTTSLPLLLSPAEAGERLLAHIGPYYEGIQHEPDALGELRGKPAGTIRPKP